MRTAENVMFNNSIFYFTVTVHWGFKVTFTANIA